jgi:hypothetical protein
MRLFVPLKESELQRLREVADAERRDPRDQAALLIVQGLTHHPGAHGTPTMEEVADGAR